MSRALSLIIVMIAGTLLFAQHARLEELTCLSQTSFAPTAPLQETVIPYATKPESVVLNGETGTLYALTTDGHFHIWQGGQEITCSDQRPMGKLTLNPAKNELYLSAPNETLVISGRTGEILHRLSFVGDLAVSPLNKRLLIVSGHDVLLIDTDTYEQVSTVPGTYIDNPDLLNYDGTLLKGGEVTDRYPLGVVTNVSSGDYWIIFNNMMYGHGGYWGEAWVEALDPVTFETKWSGRLDPVSRLATDTHSGIIYFMDQGHHDASAHHLQIYDSQYQSLKSLMMPITPIVLDEQTQRLYSFLPSSSFITVIDAKTFELIDRIPYISSDTFIAAAQGYLLVYTPTELHLISADALARTQHASVEPVESLPLFTHIATLEGALLVSGQKGLFRSADNGITWQRVLPCSAGQIVMPAESNTLFITCPSPNPYDGEGLFRSTDAGQTWQSINRGLSGFNYEVIVFSPTFTEDHTVWTRTRMQPDDWMVSYDAGDHWQSGNAPVLSETSLSIKRCDGVLRLIPQHPLLNSPSTPLEQVGWVVGDDFRLYHYDLEKTCWTLIPDFQGRTDFAWWGTPVNPFLGVVSNQEAFVSVPEIVGTSDPRQYISHLYHSTNGGTTWQEIVRATLN